MGDELSTLEQPFGVFRFFKKTMINFSVVAGSVGAVGIFNDWLMGHIKKIAAVPWAVLVIFAIFALAMLGAEFMTRSTRLAMERQRSQPAEPRRRAKIKAARQQRLRQRR